jgi:hypothetical protein
MDFLLRQHILKVIQHSPSPVNTISENTSNQKFLNYGRIYTTDQPFPPGNIHAGLRNTFISTKPHFKNTHGSMRQEAQLFCVNILPVVNAWCAY